MIWYLWHSLETPKTFSVRESLSRYMLSTCLNHRQRLAQKAWTLSHVKRKCAMESLVWHESHWSLSEIRRCFKKVLQGMSLFKILNWKLWSLVSLVVWKALLHASVHSEKSPRCRPSSPSTHLWKAVLVFWTRTINFPYILLGPRMSMSSGGSSSILMSMPKPVIGGCQLVVKSFLHSRGIFALRLNASKKVQGRLNLAEISWWDKSQGSEGWQMSPMVSIPFLCQFFQCMCEVAGPILQLNQRGSLWMAASVVGSKCLAFLQPSNSSL